MVRFTKEILKGLSEHLEWDVGEDFDDQLDRLFGDDEDMALSVYEFMHTLPVAWLDLATYLADNMSPAQWHAYHAGIVHRLLDMIPKDVKADINHYQMHADVLDEVFRNSSKGDQ